MSLLVTCCINLSTSVNSPRDSQHESILFFFAIFYDVLILFTSEFFIVVCTLEEVGPWKKDIFFSCMTFMIPVGFGRDPSFSLVLTCQRNTEIKEHGFSFSFLCWFHHRKEKMHDCFFALPFLVKHVKFQVCTFKEIAREYVNTTP